MPDHIITTHFPIPIPLRVRSTAMVVWPAGFVIAFASTLALGGYVQRIWLAAQVALFAWGIWALFQTVGYTH
jgi:hypothetical protein